MSHATTQPTIKAELREKFGHQTKSLRRSGFIPVEVYGNVKENLHIAVAAHDFAKLIDANGTSVIYKLELAGEKNLKVLVQDIQLHPVRSEIVHVDLFAVNAKEKLSTEVPLTFVGEADAVEILGGTLVTVRNEIEIECLPDDLPHDITVDLSVLKGFDDSIRVKDLTLPAGVTSPMDAEEVLVSITEPISEAELAALDEAPAAAVETEFGTKSGTDAAPAEDAK